MFCYSYTYYITLMVILAEKVLANVKMASKRQMFRAYVEIWRTDGRLSTSKMRKGAVGFGHPVAIFFLFEGGAGFVVGVDDF